MAVISYGLDREVFTRLEVGKQDFKQWKGKASDISDYVAAWGVVRFWALSRSPKKKGGIIPINSNSNTTNSYFAWIVAREVVCLVIDSTWEITSNLNTNDFEKKFDKLDINQQVLLAELLIEIADTIQFWTMRFSDSLDV